MGMYPTKTSSDDCLSLDTQWLKKHGYLCGFKSGGIKWTFGFGGESSISFSVDAGDSPRIRFQYSTRSWGNNEKHSMDYSFSLVKVPCNLSGYRWAFRCELVANKVYCGRLVYKLYKGNSDYFGCRRCMGIVYESQRRSGSRFEFLGQIIDAERKEEKLYAEIKKWNYRGRPTRKARRLARLQGFIPHGEEYLQMFQKFGM